MVWMCVVVVSCECRYYVNLKNGIEVLLMLCDDLGVCLYEFVCI